MKRFLQLNLWEGSLVLLVLLNWLGLSLESAKIIHPLLAVMTIVGSGFMLVRLLPDTEPWPKSGVGVLGLSALTGFLLTSVLYLGGIYMLAGAVSLSHYAVSELLSITFLILTIISMWRRKIEQPRAIQWGWQQVSLLIALAASTIPYIANSFAQNNDGFLMQTIKYANGGKILLSDLRPIYSTVMAAISNLTNLNPVSLYAIVPFLLFAAAVLVFWDYCRSKNPSSKLNLPTLFLLATPVIVTEIFITRPQVILLAFTLPLLIILTKAYQEKSLVYTVSGFFLSILLVPFHELSIVFGLCFIILLLVQLYRAAFIEKTLAPAKLLLIPIIVFPYLLIPAVKSVFARSGDFIAFLFSTTDTPHWRWWFINSYKSIDGAQLGWPGLQALQYYLYNGFLLFAVLILAFFLFKKNWGKNFWKRSLPVLLFTLFFLFFAEIAPRFGFYFLLNRTWPYIALAVVFWASQSSRIIKVNFPRWFTGLFLGCVAVGIAGISVVARNNVQQIFPEERGAINFLKEVPRNSIVLSNQDNRAIVEVYATLPFQQFSVMDAEDQNWRDDILAIINRGDSVSTDVDEKVVITDNTASDIESSKTTVKTTVETTTVIHRAKPEKVYYIFSKRKATGLNAQRTTAYFKGNDLEQTLLKSNGTIVFEDAGAIVYDLTPQP